MAYGKGWKRDRPDPRDHLYALPSDYAPGTARELPPFVDLRAQMPPVYDQGQLGSCVFNALAAALQSEQTLQGEVGWTPSRLFMYYNTRVLEGTVTQDAGAEIRDGIKSAAKIGAPPETDWPYEPHQFDVKPSEVAYADAPLGKALAYFRVQQDLLAMKDCLFGQRPIIVGIQVYESFESSGVRESGIVPMPGPDEQVLGGHALLVVGYDDARAGFIFRNSWGSGWAMEGYGLIPYDYLLSPELSGDFWTVTVVP